MAAMDPGARRSGIERLVEACKGDPYPATHEEKRRWLDVTRRRTGILAGNGMVRPIIPAYAMQPLRYSINVTLDGCCDHRAATPDEDLFRNAIENINRADALLFGRVTYEMMEGAWRQPVRDGARPDWIESGIWLDFARTISEAKKYVVSGTLDPQRLDQAHWNAELLRGDLERAVQQLKQRPGKGLMVGGVKLPLALAELGLIDEYEFVVHPGLAGHGPTLFAGLSKRVELKLVSRLEFGSGAVAMRYVPRR